MTLTAMQEYALMKLNNRENIFLTGKAGTGKSFLLQKFIKSVEDNNRNLLVTAPTGVAALNIGGATLHRTFNIPMDISKIVDDIDNVSEKIINADIIIIDEISMVRKDVFEYVIKSISLALEKRRELSITGDIQVVLCGDFFQLPPVLVDKDKKAYKHYYGDLSIFPFNSKYRKRFDFTTIELEEVVRQEDTELIENLNKARVGDNSCIDYFNHFCNHKIDSKKAIVVSATNRQVSEINSKSLREIEEDEKIFESAQNGKVESSDKPADDRLVLKKGARVMTLVNDKHGFFSNGSLGFVYCINDDCVTVKLDNGNLATIEPYVWSVKEYQKVKVGEVEKYRLVEIGRYRQLPLKIAFAITIHKSQGKTFENVEVYPYCWDAGQLYVALSRCTNEKGLSLAYPIKEEYLISSQEVYNFYYKKQSDELEEIKDQIDIFSYLEEKEKTKKINNKKTKTKKVETRGRKKKYNGLETCVLRVPIKHKDLILSIAEVISEDESVAKQLLSDFITK